MARFRPKLREVEAFQLPAAGDDNTAPFLEWAASVEFEFDCERDQCLSFDETLADGDTIRVQPGPSDWIVKLPSGQFCAVSPEVFDRTYEPVEHVRS